MLNKNQLQKGFGKLAILGTLSVAAIGFNAEMSLAIPLKPIIRRAVEGILGIPPQPQNLPQNQQQFPQGATGYPNAPAPQYPGQPNVFPQYPTPQPPIYQQPIYQQPTNPQGGYPVYPQPYPAPAPVAPTPR
ncbi:hypothetical protein [Microcoleus sp. herbarium14]|uniref:hypothetical protein n=1 Tax=Microcoleus sp. herbarium14 TaxID=3055439 RepID=UPI002FD022EC